MIVSIRSGKARGFLALYLSLISLFISLPSNGASQEKDRLSMIAEMETQSGLLDLHYSEKTGKVLLSIPKTGADYIFQTSLPRRWFK